MVYLIGSLRNPQVPLIAEQLRAEGHEVFDDWYAAGPEADDKWRDYEKSRGHTYREALSGHAARHVFQFDYEHLTRAEAVVLALPAGRSGGIEFGWARGQGKPGYILLDSPERWDVMFQFATKVVTSVTELLDELANSVDPTPRDFTRGPSRYRIQSMRDEQQGRSSGGSNLSQADGYHAADFAVDPC